MNKVPLKGTVEHRAQESQVKKKSFTSQREERETVGPKGERGNVWR